MIAKWIIIGWVALATITVVALVGKPRKPITPGTAAVIVALNAIQIVAMVIWWRA